MKHVRPMSTQFHLISLCSIKRLYQNATDLWLWESFSWRSILVCNPTQEISTIYIHVQKQKYVFFHIRIYIAQRRHFSWTPSKQAESTHSSGWCVIFYWFKERALLISQYRRSRPIKILNTSFHTYSWPGSV